MSFDTTRLVNQVTIKGSLPDGRFSTQEILDLAYDVLLSEIMPMVLGAREEYMVSYKDIPIVAGQAAYEIPTRALNGVLREVKIIEGSDVVDLERIVIEDVQTTSVNKPESFYISGSDVNLYPTPSSTQYTLRLYYFIRPSRLVPVSECARITAISGNEVTLSIPSGWLNTDTFDLVKGRAYFSTLGIDLTASSVAGGVITFDQDIPASLVVGDYVTLAEETCFPYLPPEGHVALIQATVTAALESMGDPNATGSAQKAEMLKGVFAQVLGTRVQGEQIKPFTPLI